MSITETSPVQDAGSAESIPQSTPFPETGNDEFDEVDALLRYVQRHAPLCPRCGYDLRAIREPICPECGDRLHLAIRSESVRLRWFLASLPPGFFSGICAVILTILIFLEPGAPRQIYELMWIGYASGVMATGLCLYRRRFLRLPYWLQAVLTGGIWAGHLTVFYFMIWIYIV